MSLTYLNVHTFFSSTGGPHSPEEWCRHAADLGYTQLGIADRAPLPALPFLLKASPETSLSPFIGVELDLQAAGDSPTPLPVILLPASREGLQNLAILSNIAYSQWPQAEQPVTPRSLAEHSQGLILILPDPSQLGQDSLTALKASFAERVLTGLPHSGTEEDDIECTRLAEIAGRLGLPLVALPTARYLRPDDKPAHEALQRARARAGWAR